MRIWAHFKTITKHRWAVRRLCFKVGLYWQGLTHDLSKYSPQEFLPGCRYYQGFRSPNDQERQETGCSRSWMHHKGRNRHHFEYWIDYPRRDDPTQTTDEKRRFQAVEMPLKYVAEMFCDRVAACKIYRGKDYTPADPLAYLEKGRDYVFIHPKTQALITQMLTVLRDEGEDAACAYVKKLLKDEKSNISVEERSSL